MLRQFFDGVAAHCDEAKQFPRTHPRLICSYDAVPTNRGSACSPAFAILNLISANTAWHHAHAKADDLVVPDEVGRGL